MDFGDLVVRIAGTAAIADPARRCREYLQERDALMAMGKVGPAVDYCRGRWADMPSSPFDDDRPMGVREWLAHVDPLGDDVDDYVDDPSPCVPWDTDKRNAFHVSLWLLIGHFDMVKRCEHADKVAEASHDTALGGIHMREAKSRYGMAYGLYLETSWSQEYRACRLAHDYLEAHAMDIGFGFTWRGDELIRLAKQVLLAFALDDDIESARREAGEAGDDPGAVGMDAEPHANGTAGGTVRAMAMEPCSTESRMAPPSRGFMGAGTYAEACAMKLEGEDIPVELKRAFEGERKAYLLYNLIGYTNANGGGRKAKTFADGLMSLVHRGRIELAWAGKQMDKRAIHDAFSGFMEIGSYSSFADNYKPERRFDEREARRLDGIRNDIMNWNKGNI